MFLKDIKIVDLRFSDINMAESEPDKGYYVFNHSEEISYKDPGRRPDWFFRWERYDSSNNYREFRDAKFHGWSPVINGTDPFIPAGVGVNAEKMFIFSDVVLMKRRLMDVLLEAEEKQKKAKTQATNRVKAFKDQMKAQGAGIPDSMVDDLVSQYIGQ